MEMFLFQKIPESTVRMLNRIQMSDSDQFSVRFYGINSEMLNS